mmetsp:Transcript_31337/g.56311  ORF Transcript_31337/g.56311 Transcript_31337/m.56311 type:complete len:725 (-) Transcript_31337:74-2248(-)
MPPKAEMSAPDAPDQGDTSVDKTQLMGQSTTQVSSADHTVTPQDLLAETTRAANLTGELETAKMKLADYETEVQRKEAGFLSETQDMVQELDALRTQLEILKQSDARKQKENEELRTTLGSEVEALQVELAQHRSDKERDDTENTTIMKLLHTELDKYKQQAAELQAELEQTQRDDVKNTIMLGLLNSQLDAAKDDARRSSDLIFDYKKKVELLETRLEETVQKMLQLEDDVARITKDNAAQCDQLLREINGHKLKIEQVDILNGRLQSELEMVKSQHTELQTSSEAREREQFETNVILKTEGQHYKTLAAQHAADLEQLQREMVEKSSYQQSIINALKTKVMQLQELHESSEKAAFETLTTTKSELTAVQLKWEALQEESRRAEEDYIEQNQSLKTMLAAEKQRHEQSITIADKKETEFFKQITRLTTEVDALESQVQHSTALHEKKDREYMEKTIVLNSENESLKRQLSVLTEEIDATKKQGEARDIQRETEIALLKQQLVDTEEAHVNIHKGDEEARAELQSTLKGAHLQIDQVKEEVVKKDLELQAEKRSLENRVDVLESEIEGHLETIKRLEESIADNYNHKILAEQNETLQTEIESYKNQIKNVNNTLATMKIESDILDNYKTKVLNEQNDQHLKRIAELEREHKLIAPVMAELIATLQKHGLHTSLKGDIEYYKTKFLKGGVVAADTSGSHGRSSPAAMGRHRLDPLPSPTMFAAAP